jgi:hypothetical protein
MGKYESDKKCKSESGPYPGFLTREAVTLYAEKVPQNIQRISNNVILKIVNIFFPRGQLPPCPPPTTPAVYGPD